jgi:hypothetical protein
MPVHTVNANAFLKQLFCKDGAKLPITTHDEKSFHKRDICYWLCSEQG